MRLIVDVQWSMERWLSIMGRGFLEAHSSPQIGDYLVLFYAGDSELIAH